MYDPCQIDEGWLLAGYISVHQHISSPNLGTQVSGHVLYHAVSGWISIVPKSEVPTSID